RGSREKGSWVKGSCTKHLMFRVFSVRKGSMCAELGSGNRVMTDSSMVVKPSMEEPSKAIPSSAASSSNSEAGMLKWCSLPGTSVKRMSTNFTSSSAMNFAISETLENAMDATKMVIRAVISTSQVYARHRADRD